MFFKRLYYNFITPEVNGKKIGLFRACCAIFGGLVVSYLGMTLLVFLLPSIANESIIISLWFTTLVWTCTALWIALSISKFIALRRVVIPSVVLSIALLIFFKN